MKTKATCDFLITDIEVNVVVDSASDASLMNEELFTKHFVYDTVVSMLVKTDLDGSPNSSPLEANT